MSGSWLCKEEADRERLLDMEERLKPVRRVAIGILGIALIVAAPWLGWWTLIPLAFAAALFGTADKLMERAERPEYVMFAAWALSELTIAAAIALSGGPKTATLSWLAIPVVTLSARFSLRGVVTGVAIAIGLVCAVAFATDAAAVIDYPPLVTAPVALILATAVLSTALMRSDVEHRSEAVIDGLTGMLNRKSLANRVLELEQQSEVTGQQIGLIVGDLDRFKLINDSKGHAAGDSVLVDVAYALRKQLRAFDLAYRMGGEEFVFLLPGSDLQEAKEIAELLRRTIAASRVGDGVDITMSFGVSSSVPGQRFEYERVFAAADEALYEAKSLGRNRVCTAKLVERPAGRSAAAQTPQAAASPAG
jgi:diguanylate cyclase (GGDEF)-like protein